MIKPNLLTAAACLACAAQAQVVVPPSADPGALQQRRLEDEQRRLEQERMERRPNVDPVRQEAVPAPPTATSSTARFTVRQIRFAPASEIFTADELRARVAPLEGKEVGLGDLQQVVEAINAAYRDRGVITARAAIPPQDLSGGVFTIQLVEGRVGRIEITGNPSTSETYVRDRVDAEPGKLVDLPTLQDSLVRFNRTNDAQLRANLKAGGTFGQTDIGIEVQEPDRHVFRAGLDNHGSEVTGKTRFGVGYTNNSLFGRRDALTLNALSASGLESYSVDYGLPVNRWGGRLSVSRNQDDTKLKFGPFASLGITGESTSTSLGLRQPVQVSERSQTHLILVLRKRDVENRVSGVFLSSTATSDTQLGVDHQTSDNSGQWDANYLLYKGKATTAGVRTDYSLSRGALRRSQLIADGWMLRGSLSFQHTSSDVLPTGEYFFLGGEGSVRGYPVGVFSGDRGTLLSLELMHPLVPTAEGSSGAGFQATGFVFVDAGRVKTVRPPDSTLPASESLRSVGWGAQMSFGPHVTARLTLAYAMDKLPDEPKRLSAKLQLNSQY
jgi:hemolysin activation/secretion protein